MCVCVCVYACVCVALICPFKDSKGACTYVHLNNKYIMTSAGVNIIIIIICMHVR